MCKLLVFNKNNRYYITKCKLKIKKRKKENAIKHLERNRIPALNNPKAVDVSLNNRNQKLKG